MARITLDRPAKADAVDKKASDELAVAWKEVREDPDTRVAIITGAGERETRQYGLLHVEPARCGLLVRVAVL